jgi:Flp pilus assembly protein TadD
MSESSNPAASQTVAPLLALATELLRAGRPADAIAPLRDATQLEPSNAIIQHDLGVACLEAGSAAEDSSNGAFAFSAGREVRRATSSLNPSLFSGSFA